MKKFIALMLAFVLFAPVCLADEIASDTAVYKEYEEKFGDIRTWTVEERYHVQQVLHEKGFLPDPRARLPKEGELTSDQAVQKAKMFILEQYPDAALDNLFASVCYEDVDDPEGNVWLIEFYRENDLFCNYSVNIYGQGRVGTVQYRDLDSPETKFELMQWEKGLFRTWSVEDKAAFYGYLCGQYATVDEEIPDILMSVLRRRHAVPDENVLSQADAEAKARAYLLAFGRADADTVAAWETCFYYYPDDSGRPTWEVVFYEKFMRRQTVLVDAGTGECRIKPGENG